MPTLYISLKVPFECKPSIDEGSTLIFTHWLPIGSENGICASCDGIKVGLWFEEKCTWWASQPTAEELKNYVNVLAHYVNVDVEVPGISEELASYIQSRDNSRPPNQSEQALHSSYESLGGKVLSTVLRFLNRLVAFARAKKGQYWLTEFDVDTKRMRSLFTAFEAKGRIDAGTPFRFQPASTERIIITTEDENRYINESEWPLFREFVEGNSKPELVGELLAGAEYLLQVGHRRSALTEAVTALEVALHNFARSVNANKDFGHQFADRLGIDTLQNQIKHLGLSGSIGYIIPIILPEDKLPKEIIRDCQFALQQRQNVVHNGQRDIDEMSVRRALSAIRKFCEILELLC